MSLTAADWASTEVVDQECAMCYDDLNKEHSPVPLDNCCHAFCHRCLTKWMSSNNAQRHKCPVCRAVLFNDGIGPEQQRQVVPINGQVDTPFDQFSHMRDPNNASGALFRNLVQLAVPAPRNLDQRTHTLYRDFIFDLDNVASFYRKLWRRVVRTLTQQYLASDCLITDELDTAARILLIEVLDHIHYEAVFEDDDMRDLLIRSLDGDEGAMALSRRLMQLVMVMVMLSTIMPMNMHVVLGCFELLPNLHSRLGFDIINTAVTNPSAANAPILKVVTMLLVNHSIGYVGNNLGTQWYASSDASEQFYDKALAIKGKLLKEPRARKDIFKKMLADDAEIVQLWQNAGTEAPPARRGFCAGLRGLLTRNDAIREPPRTLTRIQPANRARPMSDLASQLAGAAAGPRVFGVQIFGLRERRPRHDSEPLIVTPDERRQYQHQTHFAWW